MTAVLLLLAIAVVTAPRPAVSRARMLSVLPPARASSARRRLPMPAGSAGQSTAAVALGAGVFCLGGKAVSGGGSMVVPLLAGAIAGWTAGRLSTTAIARRRQDRRAAAQVDAVAALAAEVRAGRRPDAAMAAAGPGDMPTAVRAVWTLSEDSGAPVAIVLDRVEDDLRSRARQRQEVAAQLAGARSTALLLAGLPVVGIVLGAAMGAKPLATLFGATGGQFALLAGVVLDSAGVLWTARIVAAADGER